MLSVCLFVCLSPEYLKNGWMDFKIFFCYVYVYSTVPHVKVFKCFARAVGARSSFFVFLLFLYSVLSTLRRKPLKYLTTVFHYDRNFKTTNLKAGCENILRFVSDERNYPIIIIQFHFKTCSIVFYDFSLRDLFDGVL